MNKHTSLGWIAAVYGLLLACSGGSETTSSSDPTAPRDEHGSDTPATTDGGSDTSSSRPTATSRWVATDANVAINYVEFLPGDRFVAEKMVPDGVLADNASLTDIELQGSVVNGKSLAATTGESYDFAIANDVLSITAKGGEKFTLVKDTSTCAPGTAPLSGVAMLTLVTPSGDSVAKPLPPDTTIEIVGGKPGAVVSKSVKIDAAGRFAVDCFPNGRYLIEQPDPDDLGTYRPGQVRRAVVTAYTNKDFAGKRFADMKPTKVDVHLTGLDAAANDQVYIQGFGSAFALTMKRPANATGVTKSLANDAEELGADWLMPSQPLWGVQDAALNVAGVQDARVAARVGESTLAVVEGTTNTLTMNYANTPKRTTAITWNPADFSAMTERVKRENAGAKLTSSSVAAGIDSFRGPGRVSSDGMGTLFVLPNPTAAINTSVTFPDFAQASPIVRSIVHRMDYTTADGDSAASYLWTAPLGASHALALHGGPVGNIRVNGLPAAKRQENLGNLPLISWDAPAVPTPPSYYEVMVSYVISQDEEPGGPIIVSFTNATVHTKATRAQLPIHPKDSFSVTVTAVWIGAGDRGAAESTTVRLDAAGPLYVARAVR